LALCMAIRSRHIATLCFAPPFVVSMVILASAYHPRGSGNLDSLSTFF
jgi:hypothetical protein